MKTKSIARFSLLCAMALVLGYFERFIPVAPGIPGVKLGLANTVLLYAVYLMGAKSAMLLMLAKVVLSGLLFAGLSGMLYSLAGGLLSLCVMLLLSRLKDVGIIGVSVGGAVSHNIGQIAVACMVVESRAVLGYLPVLMISAVITGTLTGIAAKYAKQKNHPAGIIPAGSFYLLNLAMPSRLCRLFLCSRSIVAAAFSFVCPVSMYSSRSAYLRPISASSVCPSNRPAEGAFSIIHAGASR